MAFLSRRALLDGTPQYRGCRHLHSDAKPKDPFTLAQKDLKSLYDDIRKVHFFQCNLAFDVYVFKLVWCVTSIFLHPLKELFVSKEELKFLCDYYFDGKGKAIRPMIVVLMARALNIHSNREG